MPVGPEFQVNTYTTYDQAPAIEGYASPQRVSRHSNGTFVVVWASSGQAAYGDDVFAQRYDRYGGALGTEFQVNSYTTEYQNVPVVSHFSSGGFVVVWMSLDQDGSDTGIFGQRFQANGAKAGGEFRVNTFTTGYQRHPSIATTADGGFVIVWASEAQDGNGFGAFGRRFTSSGAAAGTEFRVNSYTTGDQGYAGVTVAANPTGGFLVVWHSVSQDGDDLGVFAQRFNAAGANAGTEFQVNSYTTGEQGYPHADFDAAGNAVVVWEGQGPAAAQGIYARRYSSTGTAIGDQFAIETPALGFPDGAAVAVDDDGSFVVIFSDSDTLTDDGVYAQHFDAAGAPSGSAFLVNTYTTDEQRIASIATDGNGRFVVAWVDYGGKDGDNRGMFAQRLGLDGDGDSAADEVDNCPSTANPDQLNSDCSNPTFLASGGCAGTLASENPGCCDGGDVCDACAAQRDNTLCNSARSGGATIGPAGGVIHTGEINGTISASVVIPALALTQNTSISITENGPATAFALRREGGIADVLSVSMRPEAQAFNLPVQVTLRWDDRDKDGIVDRGVCGTGADVGLPCDEDADCAGNSCSVSSGIPEDNLVLKRNNARFGMNGFGASPFTCADHLAGSGCELATANCLADPGTGKATVAKCCDPGAGPSGTRTYGEWTFETCDFSEFLVGLNASALVPGAGNPETDCTMEWAPNNPLNGRYLDNKLLPNFKQECRDGDPVCDADGLANGTCSFTMGLCAVVDEPRLVDNGAPECTSTSLAKWQLVKPTFDSPKPEETAAVLPILVIANALGPNALDLAALEFTYGPALGGDVCGAQSLLQVPLRDGVKKGKLIVKTAAEDAQGVRDTDKLKLTCLPPN